jgi:hypothetical protein
MRCPISFNILTLLDSSGGSVNYASEKMDRNMYLNRSEDVG